MSAAPALSTEALKNAMACFGTGVAVITTHHAGKDWGMTCNSFNTVSIDPAMVLWSIRHASQSHAAFAAAGGGYTVNLLSTAQHAVAMRFTQGTHAERFAGLDVLRLPSGRLRLAHSLAWFDCCLHSVVAAGDHDILIGQVLDVGLADAGRVAHPLLYAQRQFGRLASL
jgi:flavin reductase (DIM6/NTAB) family NADH-FMN oxidoreductase RutF